MWFSGLSAAVLWKGSTFFCQYLTYILSYLGYVIWDSVVQDGFTHQSDGRILSAGILDHMYQQANSDLFTWWWHIPRAVREQMPNTRRRSSSLWLCVFVNVPLNKVTHKAKSKPSEWRIREQVQSHTAQGCANRDGKNLWLLLQSTTPKTIF